MYTGEEILKEVDNVFASKWETRDGTIVPEPEDIKLNNDAVKLNGAVLYADLRKSTDMVNKYSDWFAAEVYKSYLISSCRIIQNNNGKITAFDGDRVMAVFIDNDGCNTAVKTALQINYIVSEINKKIAVKYPKSEYQITQAVGIDISKLFIARSGIRKYNDLIWIGRSANYAAKLCSIKNTVYKAYISETVYNILSEETMYGGNPRQNMWTKIYWEERSINIYGSNWWWKF